ncbi:Cd2+/Zn2+-exporting ATPase [Dethiosulfatibacter aminovorans DSM 17477]|uniref:Cd(2+)-exporting ATPase n=1 Tax=Dethiosulfatibacter aminovorans DSM 17477 TaxID=1121476 RepID=A0A1M6KQ61_9FIRM|nr:heavy metal translocating P-type ATPase [Dethiosulfatibacter aminovorans]SHJ61036.1 Cd2+/Zn2+-exporting ATPase [Dethiosulfatibacter aminovorans DSM 17477]
MVDKKVKYKKGMKAAVSPAKAVKTVVRVDAKKTDDPCCDDDYNKKTFEEHHSCGCGHCSIDFTEELNPEEVVEENLLDTEESLNVKITRIGVGALAFVAGLVFRDRVFAVYLYLTAYFILGYEVIMKAFANIRRGDLLDENFLMVVASAGAIIIGEYPEAAGVMLFYSIGEYLQDMAVDNSRKSIKALLNIKPDYANLEHGSHLDIVKPNRVKIGDIIVVKPGEKVPLDGVVVEGQSSLDTSALTGESMPQDVAADDEILAGAVNISGILRVRVSKTFGESTALKILKMVQEASNRKARMENFITKFAKYYTPAVVGAAAVIAVVPSLAMYGAITRDWIYRGLIFLVVSCPCALVLSIPLAYFGGIGAASKRGILVKGGNYLEALVNADRVIFDKTGTLTEGRFTVTKIRTENGSTEEELVYYGAYGEYYSNHPIAESIKKKYGKNIDKNAISAHEELSGFGIKAVVNDRQVLVGNEKLMVESGIDIDINEENGTSVHIAVDNEYRGCIEVEDNIKESSYNVVDGLKKKGIKEVIMLTGDNEKTAGRIAGKLKLDRYHAGLLPGDKLDILRKYLNKTTSTIAVGDGINDAPLLAGADVGFAMGALGSDAAVEAADIVLMTDEPFKIVESIGIARKTRTIVWQNIVFALGIKGLVMVLSTFGLAQMYQAIFADVGVAIIAVMNSTRIMKN